MTLRKAAEMALEALETYWMGENAGKNGFNAIQALRQALAQPEQERKWVGLTDADIAQTMHGSVEGSNMLPYQFARVIEAKLKEKNNG
jgi:hypothetical protein